MTDTILANIVFIVSLASYAATFHVGKSRGYQNGYDTGYLAGYKRGFFDGDAKAYLRHCASAQVKGRTVSGGGVDGYSG